MFRKPAISINNAAVSVETVETAVKSLYANKTKLASIDTTSDPVFPFRLYEESLTLQQGAALAHFLLTQLRQHLLDGATAYQSLEDVLDDVGRFAMHGVVPF